MSFTLESLRGHDCVLVTMPSSFETESSLMSEVGNSTVLRLKMAPEPKSPDVSGAGDTERYFLVDSDWGSRTPTTPTATTTTSKSQ